MADSTPTDKATPEVVEHVKANGAAAAPASGTSTPGAATGTATPALSAMQAEQVEHSLKVSLAELCAKAAVLYSQQRNYEDAAEVYAQAAEMQAEINGEMDPQNAEILFLYGRALFKVGQSKSDVLGGKAPEGLEPKKEPKKEKKAKKDQDGAGPSGLIAGAMSAGPAVKGESSAAAPANPKNPLFQFNGDEEWDASDDEDEDADDADADEDDEEEDDDLAVAFEVLDLARVLFEKQLEQKEQAGDGGAADKGTAAEAAEADGADGADAKGEEKTEKITDGPLLHILERLADTHDLLAEISLENERYPNAITDSRASLAYKTRFLPEESELIAEAHFKLSLALEFASVTTSGDAAGDAAGAPAQETQVDQTLRDEAAVQLEAAIASTKLKLQTKEVELATLHSPEDNVASRRQIAEVKEIVADMEQRLVDLRKPPIDLNAAVNDGLLGSLGGASASAIAAAKKDANDLSGLVRKKAKDAPVAAAAATAAAAPSTKRKADEAADGSDEDAKKARTEGA